MKLLHRQEIFKSKLLSKKKTQEKL